MSNLLGIVFFCSVVKLCYLLVDTPSKNKIEVRNSNPCQMVRWSDVYKADFESVILNFELELLN